MDAADGAAVAAPHITADEVSQMGPDAAERLGDFTTDPGMLRLVLLAPVVAAVATAVAVVLIALIALVSNLLYAGRLDMTLTPPDPTRLGPLSVAIPVVGGLLIGLMARFGSERIRGHGIPEAMETILVGGSRVEPRLAILKPISSAISIGTGGPFGAEGPIILTGGAFGSILSQFIHLSAAERKTLLVAGSAAGMTAVFGTPIASVLLGVELLLFEWKPRSFVPVAVASLVAAALRVHVADIGLLPAAPLFPVPPHDVVGDPVLGVSVLVGLAGGLLAVVLTAAVYGAEDAFTRLPVHWMWWPAMGGLVVGIGGLIDPSVLGVGYASIAALLAGKLAAGALISLLVVKLIVWSVALGSGTSGGILAPLLIIGGAMGGALSLVLPIGSAPTWALIGMAATMSGVMRSPLTSVVFALELTSDYTMLPALLAGCTAAHLVSVLLLKRSILTEKVARRGFHVMREYAVDPLEALFVRDVMRTEVRTVGAGVPVGSLADTLARSSDQRLFPVLLADGALAGVVGRREVEATLGGSAADPERPVSEVMHRHPVVVFPDETLRAAADRMAAQRVGVLPVVERGSRRRLNGLVTQYDLLRARDRLISEERHRERVLRLRPVAALRGRSGRAAAEAPETAADAS